MSPDQASVFVRPPVLMIQDNCDFCYRPFGWIALPAICMNCGLENQRVSPIQTAMRENAIKPADHVEAAIAERPDPTAEHLFQDAAPVVKHGPYDQVPKVRKLSRAARKQANQIKRSSVT